MANSTLYTESMRETWREQYAKEYSYCLNCMDLTDCSLDAGLGSYHDPTLDLVHFVPQVRASASNSERHSSTTHSTVLLSRLSILE